MEIYNVSNDLTFDELLGSLITIEQKLKDSSVYRFVVIENNQIMCVADMNDSVSNYMKIRVEEIPQYQLDSHVFDLFPLMRGKITKSGSFYLTGEPFFVVFNEGLVSSLVSAILKLVKNDYNIIFNAVDKAGYNGSCGLEYTPTLDPIESLRIARELYSKG